MSNPREEWFEDICVSSMVLVMVGLLLLTIWWVVSEAMGESTRVGASATNCIPVEGSQKPPHVFLTRMGALVTPMLVGCSCDGGIIYWRPYSQQENPCNSQKSSL